MKNRDNSLFFKLSNSGRSIIPDVELLRSLTPADVAKLSESHQKFWKWYTSGVITVNIMNPGGEPISSQEELCRDAITSSE
jgi:hypothetical protein